LRLTLLGMVANTVLAAIKLIAGILGHSHALVADGVESLSDLLSSVIVWRGLTLSAEPADEDHPYGHGKAEPIAAAMVAMLLLLAAAWIALVAVREIIAPHQGPEPFTLAVLVVVVVVKEGLYRKVIRAGVALDSRALQGDAWHHRSDALTSAAAGVGITAALIGGTGYEWADDAAALVGALIIAWNGRRLLRGALADLMDAAPATEFVTILVALAGTVEGVERVEKCLARRMGRSYFVDMHVEVNPQMSVARAHDVAHRVKEHLRTHQPAVADVLVHIEPALPEAGGKPPAH
jgi:cation diffusion facilitator family transporter